MYIIPIVFNNHFGIFLNLRCILLNFTGLRKIILAKIRRQLNKINIPISEKCILILKVLMQKQNTPNIRKAEKEERKVQATSLFPNIALSGTKL